MSITAYKRTIRETEGPRQIERRVLTNVTNRLAEHCAAYDAAAPGADRLAVLAGGLRDALRDNQRVWNALRTDLAAPDNALPKDLRAALISISLWIDRQSNSVMGGKASLRPLIDVNRSIIAGLAGGARPAVQPAAQPAVAAAPVTQPVNAAWR